MLAPLLPGVNVLDKLDNRAPSGLARPRKGVCFYGEGAGNQTTGIESEPVHPGLGLTPIVLGRKGKATIRGIVIVPRSTAWAAHLQLAVCKSLHQWQVEMCVILVHVTSSRSATSHAQRCGPQPRMPCGYDRRS